MIKAVAFTYFKCQSADLHKIKLLCTMINLCKKINNAHIIIYPMVKYKYNDLYVNTMPISKQTKFLTSTVL